VPVSVKAELVEGGQRTLLGQAAAPASGLSIASPPVPNGTIASFEATALDATGVAVIRGATVPFLLYGGVEGVSVPVFIGRIGKWSRLPDSMEHAHRHAVVASALHEYIIVAGGDASASSNPAVPDFYDLATFATLRGQTPFPRTPKSMAAVKAALLLIDEAGGTWLDLTNDKTNEAVAPSGLAFSEVAGGDTVALADGTLYIIGATRSAGEQTAKVLRIDTDGYFRAVPLATPRLGAAAASIGGKLVVAGGSADGAGVEVLNANQDAFDPVPFPSDATQGLGIAQLEGSTAILAGGQDSTSGTSSPVRTLDVSCNATCTTATVDLPPVVLQQTRVFSVASGKVVVVGESTSDGESHAFSIVAGAAPSMVELPFRERRKGATAVMLLNGEAGLVGGDQVDTGAPSLTVEAFAP
jgi:hypothetical protein